MANRYLKRCSTSWIIREIEIKTTMRYHLTLVRMAIINKLRKNKCWWACGERRTLLHYWWECKTGAATVEISMEITQKMKNRSALWPSNSTFGNLSEEIWNNMKEHKHPYVHCSIIFNHQDLEAAQVPISRWVDKTTSGHLHNGILISHEKEENFTLWDSMDGPEEYCAKWNKPVRERQIPCDTTHMWNLMNEQN